MARRVTWAEVYERMAAAPPGKLFGDGRGGAVVAGLSGRAVDAVEDADWVVDVVAGDGERRAGKPVWGLFDRTAGGLALPWEAPGGRRGRLERIGRELIEALGEDPERTPLDRTPARWAGWWEEFLDYQAGRTDTTFEVATAGQLVVVSGLRLWSVCEHHLLPFDCVVSIGYLPSGRLLGLSKFARTALRVAHRLQLQERLVEQLADEIAAVTGSPDVAVLAHGRHLCVEARGVRTPARATTLVGRGRLGEDEALRQEFLALAAGGNPPA
jgi:GTP cyclohydrolase IA